MSRVSEHLEARRDGQKKTTVYSVYTVLDSWAFMGACARVERTSLDSEARRRGLSPGVRATPSTLYTARGSQGHLTRAQIMWWTVGMARPPHTWSLDGFQMAMLGCQSMANQNSDKTHCINGHPFDEENTIVVPGGRKCRACKTADTLARGRKHHYAREWDRRLKEEAILHYGGECACCHETQIVVLTLDHVDGQGAQHRRDTGCGSGGRFYRWLRARGWPNDPELQVLCFNCNQAKHILGVCFHAATID